MFSKHDPAAEAPRAAQATASHPEAPDAAPHCRCLFQWSDHLVLTKPVEVVPGCPDHTPEDAQ